MINLRLPTTISVLTRVEAHRDLGTNSHARRVSGIVYRLARCLDVSPAESRQFARAAILHDIGKMAVPIEVLQKPAGLSREEVALIKTHSRIGHEILVSPNNALVNLAAAIALHHHERFDGSGYPNGLAGDDIPLAAQITSICDIYDALREERPYRRSMTHDEAMTIIVDGDHRTRPTHFSPRIWRAFQEISDHARRVFDAPVAEHVRTLS